MLLLVTRKLQIKSTMWYHFTSIRLAWMRKEDMGRWVECHPGRSSNRTPSIRCISYDPAVQLPRVRSGEIQKIFIGMFITSLIRSRDTGGNSYFNHWGGDG